MIRYDKRSLAEAEKKIDTTLRLVDYMRSEGIDVSKSKIQCPFHEDDDPSLSWSDETNQFKCFGCGKQGRYINFYIFWQKKKYNRDIEYGRAIEEILKVNISLNTDVKKMDTSVEFEKISMYKPREIFGYDGLLADSKKVKTLEEALKFLVKMQNGFYLETREGDDFESEIDLDSLEEDLSSEFVNS